LIAQNAVAAAPVLTLPAKCRFSDTSWHLA